MIPTRHPMNDVINRRGNLIIDGAMSTALEKKGLVLNDALWSARALITAPDLVREVHYDYFVAGADAAITDSYQASEAGFAAQGIDAQEAARLVRLSVQLAAEAREDYLRDHPEKANRKADLLIAGACGPYGAYLADGSEYTGRYTLSREEYVRFHELRVNALIDGGADILAFETQPRLDEIEALLAMIEHRDITCWVTVTLGEDGRMPDGTDMATLGRVLSAYPQVEAAGLNCVKREAAGPALAELGRTFKGALAIYPNSGETYDPVTKTWHSAPGSAHDWAHYVPLWRNLGVRCFGGCCRTLPKDIVEIVRILNEDQRQTFLGTAY